MFPSSNPSLASSLDPSLAFLTGGNKPLWSAPLLQTASVSQHDLSVARGPSASDIFARAALPALSSAALTDFAQTHPAAPAASFAASSAPSTNLLAPQRSLLPDLGVGLPDLRTIQAFQQLQAMQTLQTLQNLSNLQALQSALPHMPSSQLNLPLLMSAAAASNVGGLSALNAALGLGVQNSNQYGPINDPTKAFKSIIECGIVRGGQRVLTEYCEYFGKDVEVFTALADNLGPERRTLYKASLLANKFQCATNKLAMYLSRRRHMKDGIFQAIMFTCKPEHSCGLKTGSYLVSLDACKEFENYYAKRKEARQRNLKRRNRHAEAALATASDSLRVRASQSGSAAAPSSAPSSSSSAPSASAPTASSSSPAAPSSSPAAPAPSAPFAEMPLSEVAHPAHNLAYSDDHFPLFSTLDSSQANNSSPSISAATTGLELPSL